MKGMFSQMLVFKSLGEHREAECLIVPFIHPFLDFTAGDSVSYMGNYYKEALSLTRKQKRSKP